MLGKFEVAGSGLVVPVRAAPTEPRRCQSYEFNSNEPLKGYAHYATALDFADNFRDLYKDFVKCSFVTKPWNYLASRAFKREPTLIDPVTSFGLRIDFVIEEARLIENLLNSGNVDEHPDLLNQCSAFLIHFANVQLSAEPSIPALNCHPIDVTMVIPTQS